MLKFAANLSRLWAELPYLDRFEAAADAGFDGVGVPFPYEMPAKDTQRALWRTGLSLVQIATPPPNYTGGARGFAAVPGLEARFQYDLRRALRYCEVLHVPLLQVMAGAAEGAAARPCLVENLRYASGQLPTSMMMTLQPQAEEGAFLNDFGLAAEIVAEVGASNLGLQFHSFHAQVLHGDAVAVLRAHAPLVRHIQIADAPGEGPPGSGDIDFDALLELAATACAGAWIVADYVAGGDTGRTLGWLRN
jgi:hydroxypyruvate isomerase